MVYGGMCIVCRSGRVVRISSACLAEAFVNQGVFVDLAARCPKSTMTIHRSAMGET